MPGSPLHTSSWRGASLFTEADIPALVTTAGHGLVSGADPKQIATELVSVFKTALSWHGVNVQSPGWQISSDFLATVERKANELLDVLKVSRNVAPGERDARTAAWFLSVVPGVHGPKPPMFWLRLPDDIHRDFYLQIARRSMEGMPSATTVSEQTATMAAAASEAILAVLPTALRTAAAAARAAHELQAKTPKRVGRRPSVLNESLFGGLYRVHRMMFGIDPVTRDEERERWGPGVNWARHVIELAAERLLSALSVPDPVAVVALAAAAKLSDERITDLLEKARVQARCQLRT